VSGTAAGSFDHPIGEAIVPLKAASKSRITSVSCNWQTGARIQMKLLFSFPGILVFDPCALPLARFGPPLFAAVFVITESQVWVIFD
jgi:hypothetical protein